MVDDRQKCCQGSLARAGGWAEAISAARYAGPAQRTSLADRGHAQTSYFCIAGRAPEREPVGALVGGRNGAVPMASEDEGRTPGGDQSHVIVCFMMQKLNSWQQEYLRSWVFNKMKGVGNE